ncbi:hypothetical protein ACHAWU_001509 [Discostella pseudostelligera]|uniref:Uncharacterized protein n=1 Tax=Discostella pseudostelligera TaxID=259834 RepID=A0ABD3MRM2_9STRA
MSAALASHGQYGRVFDGRSFHDVDPPLPSSSLPESSSDLQQQQPPNQLRPPFRPVPPVTTSSNNPNESTIFISIPQFLDGQRCGHTLQRLFESASHPERLVVGLIEQVETNAATCLEEYCALLGYKLKTTTNNDEGAGTRQAQFEEEILNKCPHAKQIHEHSVRFHYMAAKGPVYARSFIRKILGDEGE